MASQSEELKAEEITRRTVLLSALDRQVGPDRFRKLSLFCCCIDLGGVKLDKAKSVSDLYRVIKDQKLANPITAKPIAVLQLMLQYVGVEGTEDLKASKEELGKAENDLLFPKLLVDLCQKLGNEDYDQFMKNICDAVLQIDFEKISEREDLMKKLIQEKHISPCNVSVLGFWLNIVGRADLKTKLVEKYEEERDLIKEHKKTVTEEETDQRSQESDSLGSSQTSEDLLLKNVGVDKADLNNRILSRHLEEIARINPEDLKQYLGLPTEAEGPLEAVRTWHKQEGINATYLALGRIFLKNKRPGSAEKIFKLASKAVRFCTEPVFQLAAPSAASQVPSGAMPGSVRPDHMWETTRFPVLNIHFINPKLLTDDKEPWKCGEEPLTVETILAWAMTWNNVAFPSYPRLANKRAERKEAHIRVWFETIGVCYSRVGRDALNVDKDEHTMYLNLYGLKVCDQKSLVIHEFGHALGLEHEHQRSDFWKELEPLLVDNWSAPCPEQLRAPFTESVNRIQTPYDPNSIMHYWFDINWLKPKYRCLKDVEKMTEDELPEIKKKVIRGVHTRDYRKGYMAESPSELDFQTLDQAYKLMETSKSPIRQSTS